MVVKVCGITRVEDAEAAVALGTSSLAALGFVFWPQSPRFIDPYRARAITQRLPAFVLPIGVFVNQPAEYVNAVASLVGLHAVQLHGDERPEYVRSVTRPVIKAVTAASPAAVLAASWPDTVTLLVDAADAVRRGGTGQLADWAAAAQLARLRRVILAGGLHAGNVQAAIAEVHPYGVDVSSGVELSPGLKDRHRLAEFFAAVAGARETVKETQPR